MFMFLALFLALPQDYVNLVMNGQYEEAIEYCEGMIQKNKNPYQWKLEMGDVYYNRLHDFERASEIYKDVVENYKHRDGWAHYRLAQVLEMLEDYLNSARMYEIVATRFRKAPLDSFSLTGVERCFKKNYQDYVAVVDGYNITRLELDEKTGRSGTMARSDERAILDQMIIERLIYTNAIKYDVMSTDFFKEGFPPRDRMLILDEVRAYEVMNRTTPTEKQMKKYYKENKDKFKLREHVMGKELVVESESLAQVLLDSLKKDVASFDTLAKQYSKEPNARSGGNMGAVYAGRKPAAVDSVIFNTEPNTLSPIVPFDGKYGIYYITAYKPDQYREYSEVVKQIESQVRAENVTKEEQAFTARLKKKAKLKVHKDSIIKATKDKTEESKGVVLAEVNGRPITYGDIVYRNESMTPQFAKLNLADQEKIEELIHTIFDEELRFELAWRNKYFLYDGYFVQMKDLLKAVLDQGLYQKVVLDAIVIDSAAVERQYKDKIEEFKMAESARVLEILFDSKEVADKVYKEAVARPDAFDSLAVEYSIAPSKERLGEPGLVSRGMRGAEYDKEIFKLKVGQISRVFNVNDRTWTIVKMVEHQPEGYRSLDEVRPMIESRMRRQQQGELANVFLDKIKEEADIQILFPEPEEIPETEPESDVEE
ncbi:MAG: peptidyl-prolyl cis-trans isomerase [candidate division WOR-3 bacterium]|nr:MAG: peptidyl-prolyl cis-trans isomerase [candidate division WOR-3 bacterium]